MEILIQTGNLLNNMSAYLLLFLIVIAIIIPLLESIYHKRNKQKNNVMYELNSREKNKLELLLKMLKAVVVIVIIIAIICVIIHLVSMYKYVLVDRYY